MADLTLTDSFNASLKLSGDSEIVEVRAQDGDVLVDLELNNEKLQTLHTWLGDVLGLSHTHATFVQEGPPVLGRIELVLRNA